jgi:hypothetical protein
MAITRCPYCHAIIDENDKYCNNCGTQLLFAEDEDVEEEIPGEKIIDADVEEKDYTVDEPEGEKKPTEVVSVDEDLEEDLEEEAEELALDKIVEEEAEEDGVTEEVILVDGAEAAEAGGKGEFGEPGEKEETAEIDATGEEDEGEEAEEIEEEADEEEEDEEEGSEDEKIEPEEGEKAAQPDSEEETEEFAATPAGEGTPDETTEEPPAAFEEEEPVIEYIADEEGRDEAEPAAPQPVTFDTQELEGMGRTIELGKEQVDKFLEVLAEKRAEPQPQPKEIREPTGTLPPWASMMKGEPVFSEEGSKPGTGEERGAGAPPTAGDEEVEIFPRRRGSDSTIGLPERVSQSPLPFERVEAEAEAGAEEEETAGEGPAEDEAPQVPPSLRGREAVRPAREPERQPLGVEEMLEEAASHAPFSFSTFFKSKAFDLLFVGLFWLVALWLAAHSLDMTLFEILGAMSGSMFLLYVVLAFMYFFLFRFFLGETLGDRLFRERE